MSVSSFFFFFFKDYLRPSDKVFKTVKYSSASAVSSVDEDFVFNQEQLHQVTNKLRLNGLEDGN